jgi:hypothetical protein
MHPLSTKEKKILEECTLRSLENIASEKLFQAGALRAPD